MVIPDLSSADPQRKRANGVEKKKYMQFGEKEEH